MEESNQQFIRQEFSGNGLMYLYCANCGKLVAYSPHTEVLNIAEKLHREYCTRPEDSNQID
jgi:hypothetical protein